MKRIASAGFTLVELIVVIAVIAVLATIIMVGYPNWRSNSLETVMKSDLHSLASAMEDKRNYDNRYPTTFPQSFKPSGENVVQLVGVTDTYFCADIYNAKVPTLVLSYNSEAEDFRNYPCSGLPTGSPLGGTIPAAPRGTNLLGDFSGWTLNGTASVTNGVLTLGANGNATSRLVRVSSPYTISVGGDLKAAQQSPNAALQPNAGYHVNIRYYGDDGTTPAVNRTGYTSNGSARPFPLGSWQNAITPAAFPGGPNVKYVTISVYSAASNYASPDLQIRNPLITVVD